MVLQVRFADIFSTAHTKIRKNVCSSITPSASTAQYDSKFMMEFFNNPRSVGDYCTTIAYFNIFQPSRGSSSRFHPCALPLQHLQQSTYNDFYRGGNQRTWRKSLMAKKKQDIKRTQLLTLASLAASRDDPMNSCKGC